jgi:adenosylhomocysteine nucleosidase
MAGQPTIVLSAMAPELSALRGATVASTEGQFGVRKLTEGVLGGQRVVLAEAGIGKVNAAVMATRLIDRYEPETIIFTGVAGGLDPDLRVGDVVVGDLTIHHDAGVIEGEGFRVHQAGHVPFFNPSDHLGYRPSKALIDRARRAVEGLPLAPVWGPVVPKVVFGVILTGDQFVNSEATRARLHREFGARAVEMEGAAVAQAAESLGVDCLVIRSLSDLAGSGSPADFAKFLPRVAINSARVVQAILEEAS